MTEKWSPTARTGFSPSKSPDRRAEHGNECNVPCLAVCELEKDAGSCSKYVNMWTYDQQQGKCVRFWYGSCEGNGNRFETEQQCQETCVSPKGIGR